MIGLVDEISVDFIRHQHGLIGKAQVQQTLQFLPAPGAGNGIMRVAQEHAARPGLELRFDSGVIHGVASLRVGHKRGGGRLAVIAHDGLAERTVHGRHQHNRIARLGERAGGQLQPCDHAGQHIGLLRGDGYAMVPLPVAAKGGRVARIVAVIAIAGMFRALAQGLYNRLGAGKIPVRHPHGQIVWADKARVPFYAAGVLALNASVKKCFVVLHQVAPPFMQRITQ